jgi:hypothetical protein
MFSMFSDAAQQELVMTFELPKVTSAAAIDLDITENGLELTVRLPLHLLVL